MRKVTFDYPKDCFIRTLEQKYKPNKIFSNGNSIELYFDKPLNPCCYDTTNHYDQSNRGCYRCKQCHSIWEKRRITFYKAKIGSLKREYPENHVYYRNDNVIVVFTTPLKECCADGNNHNGIEGSDAIRCNKCSSLFNNQQNICDHRKVKDDFECAYCSYKCNHLGKVMRMAEHYECECGERWTQIEMANLVGNSPWEDYVENSDECKHVKAVFPIDGRMQCAQCLHSWTSDEWADWTRNRQPEKHLKDYDHSHITRKDGVTTCNVCSKKLSECKHLNIQPYFHYWGCVDCEKQFTCKEVDEHFTKMVGSSPVIDQTKCNHINSVQGKANEFICTQCSKKWTRTEWFAEPIPAQADMLMCNHPEGLKTTHGNGTRQCSVCGKAWAGSGLKDSGNRTEFSTGAIRDMGEVMKGRWDLLSPLVLLRDAVHMERGAIKYTDRNWEKGLSLKEYYISAQRHMWKGLCGLIDEDHWAAARWNIHGLMHTQMLIKAGQLPEELDDLWHCSPEFSEIILKIFEEGV